MTLHRLQTIARIEYELTFKEVRCACGELLFFTPVTDNQDQVCVDVQPHVCIQLHPEEIE